MSENMKSPAGSDPQIPALCFQVYPSRRQADGALHLFCQASGIQWWTACKYGSSAGVLDWWIYTCIVPFQSTGMALWLTCQIRIWESQAQIPMAAGLTYPTGLLRG